MDGPAHYARGEEWLRQAEDPSLANSYTADRAAYLAHSHFTAAIAAELIADRAWRRTSPDTPSPVTETVPAPA
jgi:hypothetical protein